MAPSSTDLNVWIDDWLLIGQAVVVRRLLARWQRDRPFPSSSPLSPLNAGMDDYFMN